MPRASNGANAISSPTGCPHRPVASAPPFPARRSLGRRQLRDGPAAPEGLHQQHGGAESAPQNIDLISLVRERDSLRGDDLKVVVHPPSVAIREQLERFLGRLYRPPLLARRPRCPAGAPGAVTAPRPGCPAAGGPAAGAAS